MCFEPRKVEFALKALENCVENKEAPQFNIFIFRMRVKLSVEL
jgi:hypothetical protein